MSKSTILVTGSNGQIGQVLLTALKEKHGIDQVIATDVKPRAYDGRFELLDVTDIKRAEQLIDKYQVTEIYHLAALLSSSGEINPQRTWNINFTAHLNLLELARQKNIQKLFFPSTIGVYGPTTPRQMTPQHSSFEPSTVYGISKMTAELWNQYYKKRYGTDVRSLRFPGVISYQSIPKGGTTDFAVEMFFEIKRQGHYDCYLRKDTVLPMMYMPDVLYATLALMDADRSKLSTAMAYNLSGFSVSPEQLFAAIKKHHPTATISYQPDSRQQIADSWSQTIDDHIAQNDWDWSPKYNLQDTVKDMLQHVV